MKFVRSRDHADANARRLSHPVRRELVDESRRSACAAQHDADLPGRADVAGDDSTLLSARRIARDSSVDERAAALVHNGSAFVISNTGMPPYANDHRFPEVRGFEDGGGATAPERI